MNNEQREFLNLKTIPARLDMQQTAWYLGIAEHCIPIIVRSGLLKPLGRPAQNSVKYFATATLAGLREDVQWLTRASDVVIRHWQTKNARRPALKTSLVSSELVMGKKRGDWPKANSTIETAASATA